MLMESVLTVSGECLQKCQGARIDRRCRILEKLEEEPTVETIWPSFKLKDDDLIMCTPDVCFWRAALHWQLSYTT